MCSRESSQLTRSHACSHAPKGCGSNWAHGFYRDHGGVCERALEAVRHQSEACDVFSGILLTHGTGGGTGVSRVVIDGKGGEEIRAGGRQMRKEKREKRKEKREKR